MTFAEGPTTVLLCQEKDTAWLCLWEFRCRLGRLVWMSSLHRHTPKHEGNIHLVEDVGNNFTAEAEQGGKDGTSSQLQK